MSVDPEDEPQRATPGPDPDRRYEDAVLDRRRVVFGAGFAIAAAAASRHLDVGASTTVRTDSPSTGDESTAETADGDPQVTVGETAEPGPFEAPVLDESLRLQPGQTADVVLTGGRVIDPQTGFDRIGNVALVGSTIVEISDQPIAANRTVAVDGLVVSPGFVDMLSYQPNGYGEWWKIADGVTTNVGMHGLRFDVDDFFANWESQGVPIHYGGAVHNSHVRSQLGFLDYDNAEGDGLTTISQAIEQQVRNGYLGIHTQPEYSPGVSPTEMMDMGRLAQRLGVPFCVHARFSDDQAPGIQADATTELVSVARETGCHVHIEHLNSTGGTGRMAEALAEIDDARSEGLSMSACMYPYEFWATYLRSARYVDWQEKYGLSFDDLQVLNTGERLTADTFGAAYDANMLTAAFAIPATDVELGLQADFMMIGSDAILERPHNNHPRATGCFARTLGVYSRERNIIDLVDALAMMTIRPAELLGISSSAMRRKGRMQIGADADVTVFDPNTIADRSTIENPAQESTGVQHVFVAGVEVRTPSGTDQSLFPGTPIRSDVV